MARATIAVRDVKNATERTRHYVRLLTRPKGATAVELRDAVGAFTCHNSWSLGRLAETYGFECYFGPAPNCDFVVYQFVQKGAKPTAFDAKAANDQKPTKKAAAAAMPKPAKQSA